MHNSALYFIKKHCVYVRVALNYIVGRKWYFKFSARPQALILQRKSAAARILTACWPANFTAINCKLRNIRIRLLFFFRNSEIFFSLKITVLCFFAENSWKKHQKEIFKLEWRKGKGVKRVEEAPKSFQGCTTSKAPYCKCKMFRRKCSFVI